ncbi:DUF3078 domain-containing protein [Pedobacter punctiformis]|uniref:DUF3078 domain-containing protein n=1 Tax=Pedobacter punctiformis TaxID=3004097 RepID=A0ABT4L5R4_9SPHI|nr:DUF3078 domain-containing protein [Pedobacter sp. HCMS5-2]MCZ4243261.1 DUF3078 domain-containing protein [Pedobacter sp. HCMS5-2]
MKNYLAALLVILSICSKKLYAQEIDTIPINTKDLNIKLKRNPLPSRQGPLNFEPVKLKPFIVNAKVNYWKTKTAIGININQAAFSDNWKGGGVNSFAVGGLLNYKAEYNKNSYSYVSEVILQYGKVKNKAQLQKKTTDRIYWDNKASFQLSKNWFFFGSINFESQFDNGYSYSTVNGAETATLISKFMGPGYLTESVGFEYKPNKYFSTRIGTGTARQTFVLDKNLAGGNPAKNFGVPIGKTFRNELAFQIVAAFDKDIFTNTNLKARYAMFVPYEDIAVKNVDHRLDVALTAKINRFMNTSLTGVVLYDRDTDTKVQASQTLALGFTFIFPR